MLHLWNSLRRKEQVMKKNSKGKEELHCKCVKVNKNIPSLIPALFHVWWKHFDIEKLANITDK